MSIKKLLAIAIIFLGFSIAWMILGGVNEHRTWEQTQKSLKRVQNAYGGPLKINPPLIYYEIVKHKKGQVNGFETVLSYTVGGVESAVGTAIQSVAMPGMTRGSRSLDNIQTESL